MDVKIHNGIEKSQTLHFFLIDREAIIKNTFLANVPILYPMKTPENHNFPFAFRECKMGSLGRNWLAN